MSRTSLKHISTLIKSITDELPVEQSLLLDMKKSIETSNIKNARTPSTSYKPSSMNCIRQSYYQITGAEADESDVNYCLIGIAESGTDRHIRIQQYLLDMKSNGFDCEYIDVGEFIKYRDLNYLEVKSKEVMETKLYWPELNLSFLSDGIIKYRDKYYILEIKTEVSYKWQSRKGVDPNHYHQATCYALAFGIDDVIFIYENRDTCDKKAYLLHVTDEMKQDVLGYISNCDSYVSQKQVPPIPDNVSNKTCSYCPYKKICNKETS